MCALNYDCSKGISLEPSEVPYWHLHVVASFVDAENNIFHFDFFDFQIAEPPVKVEQAAKPLCRKSSKKH